MPKILFVVGARPNFVKTAPLIAELQRREACAQVVVHTGQHYDDAMSKIFFEELQVGTPDHMLDVGSGTHATQTARVMERLEPVVLEEDPDLVVVPGDVNSTLAATLVCAKLNVPVAHLEAGLRSFDRSMPEEINRIVADEFSELLFIHSEEAVANLVAEGISESRIRFVGNTMIDTLRAFEPRFRAEQMARRLGLESKRYLLVTLHRPALVDGPLLEPTLSHLAAVAEHLPVVFPVHPRTRARISEGPKGVMTLAPLSYLEFLSLEADAAAVLTDSGGVQEETTALGVPCFTLRDNTERPVTVRLGTNRLLGLAPERILEVPAALDTPLDASLPPLWDGNAAARAADEVLAFMPR